MDFRSFQQDPFAFVDNLRLSWKGVNFNIFQKDRVFRNSLMWAAGICLVAWVAFGFDSTPLQFAHVLFDSQGVMSYLLGKASWLDLHTMYNSYYGKEMHYSAFVIYFLLFYGQSRGWAGADVAKSKNIIFSFSGMVLSIGAFEWFWILCFANFQAQPWVATWKMPQLKILIQDTVFLGAGLLTCLFMLTERFHWNGRMQAGRAYFFDAKNWRLWLLILLSITVALLWIYYPAHIQQISVELKDGSVWRSSRLFPQTLYTIDLDPSDAVNAGSWYYVDDIMIHSLNTIVKCIWAYTTMMLFRVKNHA